MDKYETTFVAANHYVWGRQDESGYPDSVQAWEFAAAWVQLSRAFDSEQTHCKPPMSRGYELWLRDNKLSFTDGRGGLFEIIANPDGLFRGRAVTVPVPNVVTG